MRFISKLCYLIILIAVVVSITNQPIFAQATGKERSDVPEKYTWNLNDLFPTLEDWQKSKDAVAARFDKLESFKGKLGNSAQDLYEAVEYGFDVVKDFYRVAVYASRISDQDTRESGPMAMKQEIMPCADHRTRGP